MIGIDSGGRKVAIVDIDEGFSHVIEVEPYLDRGDQLYLLAEHLRELNLNGIKWVESPVLAGVRNIQSTIKVAQVTGLVHACLPQTHQVAVSSWKQRVVGSGNADKVAVRRCIDDQYPEIAKLCRDNQDLYDAAAIALYGRSVNEALAASGLRSI